MSRSVLIIGYGSPIRGDDAVGPLVADRLAARGVPQGATVLSRHVLTAELVPDIAAADLVIFLDAAVEGAPGEVLCRPLGPDRQAISTMAHFLDPRELLAWSEALYQRLPEAWLVSTPGVSFDYAGYQLTPEVAAAAEGMLRTVEELASWRPVPVG